MPESIAEPKSQAVRLRKYQFLKVCQEQIEQVNLLFVQRYPSLASAELDSGLCWKSIRKFLRGERVRRNTFLKLCGLLGLAPLAMAGLEQSGLTIPASEIKEVPMDLREADYEQILEFMARQKQLGKIVVFTGHDSNVYHQISKELTAKRFGAANPQQFLKNRNALEGWEKTGSLEGYLNMRQYLERDGFIPGYVYRLIRPTDGALVEYSSDFFLVRDFLGQQERICCSDPKNYRII